MQSSRVAIRQSCRAHNAFNISKAISSAFSTGSGRRQEVKTKDKAGDLRHRHINLGPKGAFSNYEAINDSFGAKRLRRVGERASSGEGGRRRSRNTRPPSLPAGLQARQDMLERRWEEQRERQTQRVHEGRSPAADESQGPSEQGPLPAVSHDQQEPPKPRLSRRNPGVLRAKAKMATPVEQTQASEGLAEVAHAAQEASEPEISLREAKRARYMRKMQPEVNYKGSTARSRQQIGNGSKPATSQSREDVQWKTINAGLGQEREKAVKLATLSEDGWKHLMHWIAKTANLMSKNQNLQWKDEVVNRVRIDMDYAAKAIAPKKPSPDTPTMTPPWALSEQEREGLSAIDTLDAEIKRFVAWAQVTPAEHAARQAVAQQIESAALDRVYGSPRDIRTEVFGSEKTGLATTTSDIDIRIYDHAAQEERLTQYAKLSSFMRSLHRALDESPDWITVVFRHSKFPIINAQHKASGIDVQIVSSPSTAKQQEWTSRYLHEIPHLRELYFVFRTALGMRGLIDVFNGGVGSYGLLIMLAAALKRRSNRPPPVTAAEGLIQIMEFYNSFMYTRHGLTLEPTPKTFLKHHPSDKIPIQEHIQAAHRRQDSVRAAQYAIGQTKVLQPYLLCLQDPADPTNDLGRKSNAIKHLKFSLRGAFKEWEKAAKEDGEGRESFLENFVGRCHEVYGGQRERVEEFGREVMARGEAGDAAVDGHAELAGDESTEAMQERQAAVVS